MHSEWMDDDSYERGCDETCKYCEDTRESFCNAKDSLNGVLDQLYSTERLDRVKLESCLDELCWHMGIKMRPGDLMIERYTEVWKTCQR